MSALPKPLHSMGGKPLLHYALTAARKLKAARLIVVCPPDAAVADAARAIAPEVICVTQTKARGTGDAARCALPHLVSESALILFADTPLIDAALLRRVVGVKSEVRLLSFEAGDAGGYGRIVRGADGEVEAIVEHRDATAAQRAIREVYAGVMLAPVDLLTATLRRVGRRNAAGERYLTDVVKLARAAGRGARAVVCDETLCLGVNDMADLARCERLWQQRQAAALMARGVWFADPARVDIRGEVRAGRDVRIDINALFVGRARLGDGCSIGANCVIEDCDIGAGTVVAAYSHLRGARVGARCSIGPFARVRAGSVVGDGSRVGNFVEVKNSRLAAGVKAGHLAYVGDSDVGRAVNIGAGAITCNFDGARKHRTVIGDEVFIGSNAQLVAPVRIGRGAYVAAGSTITDSVPARRLAIARGRQTNHARKKKPDSSPR